MPGPMGNYDDVIRQMMMQQQQTPQPAGNMSNGLPGRFPPEMPPDEGMGPPPEQIAQRFPSADQLGARVNTGQMSQDSATSESDRIQSILLQRALQQMRAGK